MRHLSQVIKVSDLIRPPSEGGIIYCLEMCKEEKNKTQQQQNKQQLKKPTTNEQE